LFCAELPVLCCIALARLLVIDYRRLISLTSW
jgi:hypothetical protein